MYSVGEPYHWVFLLPIFFISSFTSHFIFPEYKRIPWICCHIWNLGAFGCSGLPSREYLWVPARYGHCLSWTECVSVCWRLTRVEMSSKMWSEGLQVLHRKEENWVSLKFKQAPARCLLKLWGWEEAIVIREQKEEWECPTWSPVQEWESGVQQEKLWGALELRQKGWSVSELGKRLGNWIFRRGKKVNITYIISNLWGLSGFQAKST